MAASQPTWRKAYQPAEYIIDLNHSARAEQSRETQLSHRFKSVHPQADISNALDNPRWSMFCGPGINICTLATARGPSWVAASFQRMQHNAAMKPENSFGSSKKPCLFQCCTFFALFQSLTCDVRSLKAQTYIYITMKGTFRKFQVFRFHLTPGFDLGTCAEGVQNDDSGHSIGQIVTLP